MEMLMIFMVIKKYIISFADGNFLQIVGCFLKFSFMGNKTGLRSQFNILLTPTPAWKCLPTPQIFFPTQDSRLLKKKYFRLPDSSKYARAPDSTALAEATKNNLEREITQLSF